MNDLEKLSSEKEDLLENNNPGFAYVLLIIIFASMLISLIQNFFPNHTQILKTIKVVLTIIVGLLSIPLSGWIISKCHPYPRLREIDTEIKKLSSN